MTLKMSPLGWQNTLVPTTGSGAELGPGRRWPARHPAPLGLLSLAWCCLGPESWAARGLRSESDSSASVSLLLPALRGMAGGEDQLVGPQGGRWLPRRKASRLWVCYLHEKATFLGSQGPFGGWHLMMAPHTLPDRDTAGPPPGL